MKPSELSKELRRIAATIENSKSPSRELVSKEISEIIGRIASEEYKEYEVTIKVPARWYLGLRKPSVDIDLDEKEVDQLVRDALPAIMGDPKKS